ncbi:hypothetical protein KC368_g97 [Hortaea werneckii]|nr:hypothetical protein KC368_g97 [Hortaea werneckii]
MSPFLHSKNNDRQSHGVLCPCFDAEPSLPRRKLIAHRYDFDQVVSRGNGGFRGPNLWKTILAWLNTRLAKCRYGPGTLHLELLNDLASFCRHLYATGTRDARHDNLEAVQTRHTEGSWPSKNKLNRRIATARYRVVFFPWQVLQVSPDYSLVSWANQFVRAICRNTPRKALQMLHVCHDLKRANNGIPGESALYATSRRAWPSSEVVSNERVGAQASSRAVGFVAPRCRRSMRQLPHALDKL